MAQSENPHAALTIRSAHGSTAVMEASVHYAMTRNTHCKALSRSWVPRSWSKSFSAFDRMGASAALARLPSVSLQTTICSFDPYVLSFLPAICDHHEQILTKELCLKMLRSPLQLQT